MSEMRPGPWKKSQAPGHYYEMRWSISSCLYSRPGVSDGRDCVAEVFGNSIEEGRALADLFLAAPDLLAALEQVIAMWEMRVPMEETRVIIAQARAAVAKATGGDA